MMFGEYSSDLSAVPSTPQRIPTRGLGRPKNPGTPALPER